MHRLPTALPSSSSIASSSSAPYSDSTASFYSSYPLPPPSASLSYPSSCPPTGFSSRATMPPSLPSDPSYGSYVSNSSNSPHPSYAPLSIRPRPADNPYSSNSSTSSSSSMDPSSPSLPPSPSSAPAASSPKMRAPRFIDTFQSRILSKPSPDSPHSPPPFPSKPKRKRRTPVLDPHTKTLRSQRHNEAEVRRRQRLNDLLVELAEVVHCRKPQKSAILRITLEKVKTMERTIAGLEEQVKRLEVEKAAAVKAEAAAVKELPSFDGGFPPAQALHSGLPPQMGRGQSWATGGFDSLASTTSPIPYPLFPLSEQSASPQPLPLPSFMAGDYSHPYPVQSIKAEAAPPPPVPFNVFHSSAVPMDVIDLNGRLLDCNDAFAAFLGHTRDALLHPTSTFFDYTHPDSLTASFAMLSDLIANPGQTVRGLKRYVLRGGRVRTAQVTIWMCRGGGETQNHVAVIVEPVEEQPQLDII